MEESGGCRGKASPCSQRQTVVPSANSLDLAIPTSSETNPMPKPTRTNRKEHNISGSTKFTYENIKKHERRILEREKALGVREAELDARERAVRKREVIMKNCEHERADEWRSGASLYCILANCFIF